MEIKIGETIKKFRERRGLSQAQLAKELAAYGHSVLNTTIYNWEYGKAKPSIVQLFALCDILGIDDLWWDFTGMHKGAYAGLNDSGRKLAKQMIDLVFNKAEYRDEPEISTAPRLLRLYDIGVSAGTGNFLDESSYTEIEVPSYVSEAADFALRIYGDSMEPLYQDKQIVWIEQRETLSSGEIGVFFYDGNAYCKKLVQTAKEAYLRSLNEKYEDIPINEGSAFAVVGKVVS